MKLKQHNNSTTFNFKMNFNTEQNLFPLIVEFQVNVDKTVNVNNTFCRIHKCSFTYLRLGIVVI